MGYVDELSTLVKSITSSKDALSKLSNKSIARGALDGTLQFPCLVSDAIPIDMAATVARTLERVYASFVQSYLSLNNTIDISVDKNPNMFLKRFHHNIKVESTVEDLYEEYCLESDEEYDDLMKRIYNGTTKAYINESENKMLLFNISDSLTNSLFKENKELLEESLACIDFAPFPNIGNSPMYEDSAEDEHELGMYAAKKQIDASLREPFDMTGDKFKIKNGDKLRVPAMLDNDVKKSNELQPYLMQVRLMAVNDKNEFVQFMDFIVGVKVVLHNIKSEEMIVNLQSALQNNGKLFNFIRWTTGEKSLFKDLLLHVNDVKLDVANRSKGASPWWITLKRLKDTSRAQSAFFYRNKVVPNSTIVISSYDVDMIKKNFGYDLKNPKFALKLMKSLFLMNFIIIDEGTRTIDILYDGENTYQTYALETLEREVSMSSNKIGRELTRMISR